jgi:hypothetical protein
MRLRKAKLDGSGTDPFSLACVFQYSKLLRFDAALAPVRIIMQQVVLLEQARTDVQNRAVFIGEHVTVYPLTS